jgi:hypothetical protein
MARLRPAVEAGPVAEPMPDWLTWAGADDRRWWVNVIVGPTGLARFEAHRRHREARREFLAARTVRPEGVGTVEFLQAHGLDAKDRGTTRAAHLTY